MGTNKAPKRQAERGAYGNARGRERQARRRRVHLADPRVQAAMAEVEQHNRRLEGLASEGNEHARLAIAEHQHSGDILDTEPARWTCCYRAVTDDEMRTIEHQETEAQAQPEPQRAGARNPVGKIGVNKTKPNPALQNPSHLGGNGNGAWSLGQARAMLMQCYRLEQVVYLTGWGARWFEDIPLDEDGRGISRQEWLALH